MIILKFSVERFFQSKVQLGVSYKRWNIYVKSYIHLKYRELYLINLLKTMFNLRLTSFFLSNLTKKRGLTLFIDKRKELEILLKFIKITTNSKILLKDWIPGTLTNFREFYTTGKKKKNSLLRNTGFFKLNKMPDVIVSFSLYHNENSINEARALGIPVICFVNTDLNPSGINFLIVSNDNLKESIFLLSQILRLSMLNGLYNEKLYFYNLLKRYCYLISLKKIN